MKRIRNTILHYRQQQPSLQRLADACGPNASRSPPDDQLIAELRGRVARKIGLSPDRADLHHPASPWRFELVRKVLTAARDPDLAIADWLQHGTPVGIAEPIPPSGLLPLVTEERSTTAASLQQRVQWTHNHPSFDLLEGSDAPAHILLDDLVNAGHALVFDSIDEAASWLGTRPVPSPLGDVVRLKQDGSVKHRLIQDLKASNVNSASVVPERQVLPRFVDHARDIALLSLGASSEIGVFIIDFKNAFMTLPLADAERPFNTSVAPHTVSRTRPPLYDGEPSKGKFLVWRVLGFGGHSNPLTYSRVACFAARSGQALLMEPPSSSNHIAQGRLQLYVDDPAITLKGTVEQQHAAVDLLTLWWLVLGVPLSWDKGSFNPGHLSHDWIGVQFASHTPGTSTLSVPSSFLKDLLAIATKFTTSSPKTASLKDAHALCGKAGRLAQVVPAVTPWVQQLFAALAGSLWSHHVGMREAPPRRVAKRRYLSAATWLVQLLKEQQFPLRHTIHLRPVAIDRHLRHVQFDASPWGGGFVLVERGVPVEWAAFQWTSASAEHLGVVPDNPKWQSFWELATPVS